MTAKSIEIPSEFRSRISETERRNGSTEIVEFNKILWEMKFLSSLLGDDFF